MQVRAESLAKTKRMLQSMRQERTPWYSYWRELADYILPRRYVWLQDEVEYGRQASLRNPMILDGTGTVAARTLASGLMNGITSPARPWFRLRVPGMEDNANVKVWLDEVAKRMFSVMAESNFYNSVATLFEDLSAFSTAVMMIYEDDEDVVRCYNLACGEYYLMQNNRRKVDRVGREFKWRVEQVVAEFGLENCSPSVQERFAKGGGSLNDRVEIYHLVEPNKDDAYGLAPIHKYREIYWEKCKETDIVLRVKGYREWFIVAARWQTVGNDSYGTGPANDALADIKQLQHLTLRQAQGLDKTVSPPLIADLQLQNRPMSLLPNGVTYVAGAASFGAKPVYTINVPFGELSQIIQATQSRIYDFFYNPLFTGISNLDTVRSAEEISARRAETLVLLGPVLQRIEGEALDPALYRIFSIMLRKGLLPDVPEELANTNIEVQYVSVLSDAQRAVGAAPIERAVAFAGNLAGVKPEVLEVFNFAELMLDYSERLGVPARLLKPLDQVVRELQQAAEAKNQMQQAQLMPGLAQGAKNLSETDVGGGANALQQLLGGQ
jgi:hypothetical protein